MQLPVIPAHIDDRKLEHATHEEIRNSPFSVLFPRRRPCGNSVNSLRAFSAESSRGKFATNPVYLNTNSQSNIALLIHVRTYEDTKLSVFILQRHIPPVNLVRHEQDVMGLTQSGGS